MTATTAPSQQTDPVGPRRPERVHVIASDAEAIEVARSYADRIRVGASTRDAHGTRPWDEVRDLAGTGLLGVTVPSSDGGADVSTRTVIDITRIISAADPAIGQIPQNHFVFVGAIRRQGTPDQQRRFFAELLAGALLGNALSERGSKAGPANIRTRLERDAAGGFRLNGRKYYSTGALFAQWVPVMALDPDEHLTLAYVERDADGVKVVDDWSAMGQRGTASGTVILDDVHVPDDQVVPYWRTYELPQTAGAFGQLIHAAIDVAIAEEALADAADYVRTRSRAWWESGLDAAGDEPHLLKLAGELHVKVEAARALVERAAEVIDEVDAGATNGARLDADGAARASLAVAGAKAYVTDVVIEVTNELFTLAGTSATDERWNLHRHWRNARTHTLHDPARWKYHHVGNWVLNGTAPPNHGLL